MKHIKILVLTLFVFALSIQSKAFTTGDSVKYIVVKKTLIRKQGLWRATSTFSLGLMNDQVRNAYIQGTLENYFDFNLSIRGDGYYFLNSVSDLKPLAKNHQIYAGLVKHWGTVNWEGYAGLQPGIAISQRTDSILIENNLIESETAVTPLFSPIVGVNYYTANHFHFFLETRYTRGIHLSNSLPKYLDEIRFSFGLGFHF